MAFPFGSMRMTPTLSARRPALHFERLLSIRLNSSSLLCSFICIWIFSRTSVASRLAFAHAAEIRLLFLLIVDSLSVLFGPTEPSLHLSFLSALMLFYSLANKQRAANDEQKSHSIRRQNSK